MDKVKKLLDIAGDRNVIILGTGPVMSYSKKLNHIERVLKPNFNASKEKTNTPFTPNENYYLINDFLKAWVKQDPNFYYIDPREPFCQNGKCFAQKDGVMHLSDWDHLSKDGSLYFAEYFEEEILQILNER